MSKIISNQDLQKFFEKIDNFKRQDKLDLSLDEDLSLAVMNLISIEEHFYFTGAKTGKAKYFDLLDEVRSIRKILLKKLIKDYEGEVWCISKHLLAASMRLMECGTKQLSLKNKEAANNFFGQAYDLYCLFWGINLKVVDLPSLKEAKKAETKIEEEGEDESKAGGRRGGGTGISLKKGGLFGKLRGIVQKVIDCCIE